MPTTKPLPQIISRQAAYQLGSRRFYTGEACRNGHISERYVSNGACVGCLNGAFKFRKNAFSHELVPFASTRLWMPRSLQAEQLPALDRYLQTCIMEFSKHAGKLTQDVEDALVTQLEKM